MSQDTNRVALMIGGRGWQLGKLLPYDWRAGLALARSRIRISIFSWGVSVLS
jgi:hypothetical protein